MRDIKKARIAVIIFLLAFVTRLIVVFVIKSYRNIYLWEYGHIAMNILSGKGFVFEHFKTIYYSYAQPLLPIFISIFYKITNFNSFGLLIFQCLVSAGLCVTVFFIALELFRKNVAIVAGMFVVFHPGLLIYSTKTVHALTFDAFFFALLILVIFKLRRRCTIRNQLIVGMVLGLCILTRATAIFFLPFAFGWLLWGGCWQEKKKYLLAIVSVTIICAGVIAPWTVRNYLHYKRFVFIGANSWELLWRGNNPSASGTLYYKGGKSYSEFVPANIIGKSEDEQNAMFREEVLKFFKKNPYTALKLYFKKIYYFWWFSEFSGKEYPILWFRIYKIYYLFILLTFLYGLFRIFYYNKSARIRYEVFLIIMLLISLSLGQSLFYVEGRHRWEVEALMLIFSSFCLIENVSLSFKQNIRVLK